MTNVILLGLFLSFQLFTIPKSTAAESPGFLKEEMLFTELFSSVQMRTLQTKLEGLCKFTSTECFVKTSMMDAVPLDKTGLDIANVVADRQLFGRVHSEKSDAKTALKLVLKVSRIHKNKETFELVKEVMDEINALSLSEQIEVSSGIIYSSLTNQRMMMIVLKNKKFQSAEVITFGAGESVSTF